MSRRPRFAWNAQPPEVGLQPDRERLVTAVRARHAVERLSQSDQHQLSLAHVPKTRGALALLTDLRASLDEGPDRAFQVRRASEPPRPAS